MQTNNLYHRLRAGFPGPITRMRKLASRASKLVKSCPPFFLALLIMAGYAVWDARTPVTMIAPFQLPKTELPFTGDIVGDAVQDGLKSIQHDIEEDRRDTSLRSSDTGLPDLRNVLIPKFWRVQAPPRFTVQVKGVSYERILSVVRALMHTETDVSGDVIVKGDKFRLIARAPDAGPWESAFAPISAAGLKHASRDLAEKILAAEDPTLAGVALLKDGQIDLGLAEFNRARSLKPTDARLKLNLCMAFAAGRRYDDAIRCYKDMPQVKTDSPPEILNQMAQVYYLKGDRDVAIDHYKELRNRGYRDALLGLGEAWDDSGHPDQALKAYDEFLAKERNDGKLAIAHVKRSAALVHLGMHKDALEEYEKALQYAPQDVLILVHQGVELSEAVDLDAGIAKLRSVVNGNENSDSLPFARLQLGELLEKKGHWRDAIDEYQQAAQLRPTYVEAHLKLAHALVHEGQDSRAFDEYKKVAGLSASDLERGYPEMFADQWLATELRDLSHYAGAVSAYRSAIHIKSDYSAAHCQLTLILARQGHLSGAVQEFSAALVPAKLQELNDSECLVIADHVLDQAVAGRRSLDVQAAAEFRKIKYKINAQPAMAENATQRLTDKGGVVEQANLRTHP